VVGDLSKEQHLMDSDLQIIFCQENWVAPPNSACTMGTHNKALYVYTHYMGADKMCQQCVELKPSF